MQELKHDAANATVVSQYMFTDARKMARNMVLQMKTPSLALMAQVEIITSSRFVNNYANAARSRP